MVKPIGVTTLAGDANVMACHNARHGESATSQSGDDRSGLCIGPAGGLSASGVLKVGRSIVGGRGCVGGIAVNPGLSEAAVPAFAPRRPPRSGPSRWR